MELRNHLVFTITAVIMYIASTMMIDASALNGSSELERIFLGTRDQSGEFCSACALYKDEDFICTCFIIGPTTILTAAHCVNSSGETVPPKSVHVICNVDRTSSVVRINIANVTPHQNYSETGFIHDIAVLKSTEPITFTKDVCAACIASNKTGLMQYKTATAIGYGDITGLGILPSRYRRYAEQRIRENDDCTPYYLGMQPDDCMICAGGDFFGICPGDSGGPLAVPKEESRLSIESDGSRHSDKDLRVEIFADQTKHQPHVAIGIVSYGVGYAPCGTIVPAVWTRASCYEDFILSIADEDICVV